MSSLRNYKTDTPQYKFYKEMHEKVDLEYTLMENDKVILGMLAAILHKGLKHITIPLPIIMK